MKCVSKIEWDSIVGSHLVGLTASTARTMSTVEPCSHRIPIEKAHALVSRVVYWVTEPAASNPKSYVFVDSFDVWPDLDNRLLYQCLRARHGNHDSLESQPGHICLGHERAEVGALLLCALMTAWGVVFQVEGSERAMRIDHDGHLTLWGCNGAAESEAVRLTKLMLP